jgi:hypothetical protein
MRPRPQRIEMSMPSSSRSDAQFRRAVFQRRKARHQPQCANRRDRGQPYHRAAARFAPSIGRVGDQRKGLVGAQIKALAFQRQRNAARAALEQSQAKPSLQLGDLAADRAMREVQPFGGRGKAAHARGRLEGAQCLKRQYRLRAVIHTHS